MYKYTFDLIGQGNVLSPDTGEGRVHVLDRVDSDQEGFALCAALEIIRMHRPTALAIRREINRLHDPAEYHGTGAVSAPDLTQEKAARIVDSVVDELSDRAGFDSFWDNIDGDTRDEILSALAERVCDSFNSPI